MRRALLFLALTACRTESAPAPAPVPAPAPAAVPDPTLVLLALGDIELARDLGQSLLRDPTLDPLRGLAPLLAQADIRFANLESQLGARGHETISPTNPLVFIGPPTGAAALHRAGIDIVSTANNHAWDYGKSALISTLDLLDAAAVAHVGTSREPGEAARSSVVEKNGLRVAFVAGTAVWNQGQLAAHEARSLVASDVELVAAVREARARSDVHFVIASFHGGEEYQDAPLAAVTERLHELVLAGADAVIGHHPHVMQGVEIFEGKPIFYSLGNVTMRMHRDHRWTELGLAARLRLTQGAPPQVEACAFRIRGSFPELLDGEGNAAVRKLYAGHLTAISRGLGTTRPSAADERGCMSVEER